MRKCRSVSSTISFTHCPLVQQLSCLLNYTFTDEYHFEPVLHLPWQVHEFSFSTISPKTEIEARLAGAILHSHSVDTDIPTRRSPPDAPEHIQTAGEGKEATQCLACLCKRGTAESVNKIVQLQELHALEDLVVGKDIKWLPA
jgi:hypothetical protein